ncbi:MAG TPA: hypothetical protein VNL94_05455 [Candidatus Binatia bacterium]|nr:hypothetical protein [Candidatus Binatia bacterium]
MPRSQGAGASSAVGLVRAAALAVVAAVLLAACGPGDTTPPDVTPDPTTATAIDGRFELRFTVDRTTLRPGDDITGTAELWLRAGGSGLVSGPGEMFGFEFVEVGGQHRAVLPVFDASCQPHQVGSDTPLTSPLRKSGAADSDFAREFHQGREIHLPPGQWDITAVVWFHEGRSCGGLKHQPRATVRVVVNG